MVRGAGIDLIWFSYLCFVVVVEMAQITPADRSIPFRHPKA